ncbi:hypothetical protein GCM10009654_29780 [Streptomyces hebeiensis]|uniref:DUF4158 domain-containing protein n=1 Tax=Streptomyces hebeiensis TaxID=229486 RepID=A0ABP4FGM2_9ACTN
MTSIERTAYPRFKRLITAHELHLFFSPGRDELEWAADATDCDEHLLDLLLTLKSYRRTGCFPALEDVPRWWWTSSGGRWSCRLGLTRARPKGGQKFQKPPPGRLPPGGVLLVALDGGQAAYWAQ